MGLFESATQEWTLGNFLTNFFQMKINVFKLQDLYLLALRYFIEVSGIYKF